jgi:type I restriction enzyme S subunit
VGRFRDGRFGEFLTQRRDFLAIDAFRSYQRARVQLHGNGILLRDEVLGSEIKTKKQQAARTGDLLVAEIDAKVGGFGIVPTELDGAIVSSHYFLFEVNEQICLKAWLDWYVRSGMLEEQVKAQGSTNYAAIRPSDVLAYQIPLLPPLEQRRIVARIEALARRVEEARRLRREATEEAEALWGSTAAELLTKETDLGRHSIGDICEVRGGLQKSPARAPRDHPTPYLTVAHVQRNRIDVGSDLRYFEVTTDELTRWRLEFGDLLIIEGNGSADQIGRVALFRNEIENCVHQNHVIRARPDRSKVNPEYLNAFLNSPLGQEEVQKRSRTTSGLRTLSVGRIQEIQVPLPTLAQQGQIVVQLSRVEAEVGNILRLQVETQKELDALMPSILANAFAGEL